ncbi:MAG: PASTA domain-containing protein, partial [Ruminococcus sp.]|nr:PASTA domain-containing protein [Ruminococcus sp.]
DIKPQNIMLFPDGTIKVMDFGIARFAREEGKTISDKAIGSVHYISPEQARGDITDEKSDIYSVGVMLYEMLTGVKPFDADTPVAVAVMHMQSSAKMPRSVNDTIPEGLESIVVRAMQRDAARRYQSASEMIKDIEEFKRNPSIVFEYSYPESSDEGKTIYFDKPAGKSAENLPAKAAGKAVAAARYAENSVGGKSAHGKSSGSKKNEVRKTKPKTKANEYYEDYEDDDEDEEEVSKSSYFVVALTAIAAAVVIIAVVFIAIQVFINIGTGTEDTQAMVDLKGYDFNQCKSMYAQYFNLTKDKEIYSSEYPAGVIIEHSPKAGSLIVVGNTEVRATVSRGPQMVTVPNTYSVDANTAGAMIEGVGLTYNFVMQYSDVEKNTVIKTEPERNEEVERGSMVFVYVSRGPEEFDKFVPDVEGLKRAEAVERLEKEGFTVQLQEQDSSEEKDIVLHQSVPHLDDNGQPNIVSSGTVIILTYSSGVVPMSTVNITFAVPEGLTGKAAFNAYVNGILSGTHEVDNIGYVQTITVEVEGKDTQKVVIEAVGSDGRTHSMAEYNVDFNSKSVSESRFDRDLLKTLYGIPEETAPAVPETSPDDTGFIDDEFPEIPSDITGGDNPQIIGTGDYESWWDQITNGQ